MVAAIISIAVVVVVIVIILAIMFYNQMLLVNEINKRLLLIAKDAIDNERNTEDELQDALRELEEQASNRNEQQPGQNPGDDYEITDLGL